MIIAALTVPTLAGLLVAALVWFVTEDPAIGNAVGAAAVLVAALLLFAREYVELSRMHEACNAAGKYCPVFPGDFNQYSRIGLIAFIDVGVMYLANLFLEEWQRRRAARHA